MSHYRPISLCNVSSKIISKILSNRLKSVLARLISPMQATFVPGRTIQENSSLAHEIFHTMNHRRRGVGLLALKADMERAYDKMEWEFIRVVLRCFGFHEKWIHLIFQCLSSVSFSILLNGSPFGLFKPSRGLRQCDPLSPFLFIMGMEVLSRLMMRAEASAAIHGIKISRAAPPLSHLLFADDTMVFARATVAEFSAVVDILSKCSGWSGQTINLRKSLVFFSKNVALPTIELLLNQMGIDYAAQQGTYLGLPLILPRSKRQAHLELKRKLLKKVSGWKSKLLS